MPSARGRSCRRRRASSYSAEKAISEDPTYAPAFHGLTDFYFLLADEGFAPPGDAQLKGKAASERALQLDPNFAPAKASLAYFKLVHDWDLQGAEQDYRKLLAENPSSDSIVYDTYAISLRTLGRGDESIAAMRKALQLDPLSVSVSTESGWLFTTSDTMTRPSHSSGIRWFCNLTTLPHISDWRSL